MNSPRIVQEMSGTYTSDVVIEKDNYVIIKNKVIKFAIDKKILIKPGGVLRIVNSTLTVEQDNSGGTLLNLTNYWVGIEVQGIKNKNQDAEFKLYCNDKLKLIEPGANLNYAPEGVNQFGTTPNHGIVYAENSTIKYAGVGIKVGDEVNSKIKQNIPNVGAIDMSGGFIVVLNCKFQNFANSGISFAPFKNLIQQSVINSSRFEMDFRANISVLNPNGIYGNLNYFKQVIENNYFTTLTTNSIGKKLEFGIQLIQCGILCKNNSFVNVNNGINMSSYYQSIYRRTEITDNYFINIRNEGIGLIGTDQDLVKNNNINNIAYGQNSSSEWSIGIACFGGNNRTLESNVCRISPSINVVGRRTSFFNENYAKIPALILKNESYNMQEALRFQENNTGSIFNCNRFSSNIGRYIAYEVADIVKDTRFPGMGHKGSSGQPLANYFTQNLKTTSDHWNIIRARNSGGTAPSIDYYYNNNVLSSYRPQLTYPGTVDVKLTGSPNPNCSDMYGTNLNIAFNPCGRPSNPAVIPNVKSGIVVVKGQYQNALDAAQNDYDKSHYLAFYDNALLDLTSVFQYEGLGDSANWDKYRDSVIAYTLNHNSSAKYFYGIPYLVQLSRFSEAQILIDTMLNRGLTDTVSAEVGNYYSLIKQYTQANYADTCLKSHFNDFYQLAVHNGIMKAKAATLAQFSASLDSNNLFYDSSVFIPILYSIGSSGNSQNNQLVTITPFPCPFENSLSVKITNTDSVAFSGVLEIRDKAGSLKYSTSVSNIAGFQDFVIGTSNYTPDFYFITLFDNTGARVDDAIVIKE